MGSTPIALLKATTDRREPSARKPTDICTVVPETTVRRVTRAWGKLACDGGGGGVSFEPPKGGGGVLGKGLS